MFDDGELFHIFHLQAPRKTSNANERHFLASVGHATSLDLINWSEVGTALEKSPAGAWDDVAKRNKMIRAYAQYDRQNKG